MAAVRAVNRPSPFGLRSGVLLRVVPVCACRMRSRSFSLIFSLSLTLSFSVSLRRLQNVLTNERHGSRQAVIYRAREGKTLGAFEGFDPFPLCRRTIINRHRRLLAVVKGRGLKRAVLVFARGPGSRLVAIRPFLLRCFAGVLNFWLPGAAAAWLLRFFSRL